MYIIQYASSSSNKRKILPRYQRISCAMHNSDLFLPILQCNWKRNQKGKGTDETPQYWTY